MAVAEHEITQPEATQDLTIRLTEAQFAKLHEAAAAQGQSAEDFAATVIADAAENTSGPVPPLPTGPYRLDNRSGVFEYEPELDALMEYIHEEQRKGIEQFRAEEAAEEAAEQAKALQQ